MRKKKKLKKYNRFYPVKAFFVIAVIAWGFDKITSRPSRQTPPPKKVEVAAAPQFEKITDEPNLPVLSPRFAQRKTAKIRLENGLEAYLISDPNIDQAAASLAVGAGSWDNPKEHPGLAHFLEHMLFMGTASHPEEGSFHNFLEKNGGRRNAYTASSKTVYAFSINPTAFNQALSHFSEFFYEPLISSSALNRERNAVHQEFMVNLNSDKRRIYHVFESLINKDHPASIFATGNLTSLAQADSQTLKKWFAKYYRPSEMKLVVMNKAPLKELENQVVAAFSKIPNAKAPKRPVLGPQYSDSLKKQIIYVEPIKENRELMIRWEIPKLTGAPSLANRPENLSSFIMGHEGQTSLLKLLKQLGYAQSLACGHSQERGQSEFVIDIMLTEEGVKNWKQVLAEVFEATAILNKKGVPAYLFEEQKALAKLGWEFPEHSSPFDYTMHLAALMLDEPLETFPEKTFLPTIFNETAIKEQLAALDGSQAIVCLSAPEEEVGIKPTSQQQWTEGAYALIDRPELPASKWAADLFAVPLANRFIPILTPSPGKANFSANKVVPKKILSNELSELYHHVDNSYGLPLTHFAFRFKTPSTLSDKAEDEVLRALYIQAFTELFNPIAYEASMAGFDTHIDYKDHAMRIICSGWCSKIPIYLEKLAHHMQGMKVTKKQFETYKSNLETELRNRLQLPPYQKALAESSYLLNAPSYQDSELLATLNDLNYNDFSAFAKRFYNELFIEALCYGCINEQEATDNLNIFFTHLNPKTLDQKRTLIYPPLNLNNLTSPYSLNIDSKQQGHAICLSIDTGPYSFEDRVIAHLLSKGLSEPFYSELRTKQQTGYIVHSWADDIHDELYSFFLIQSSSHNNKELLARIELFLEHVLINFEAEPYFSRAQFDQLKQALVTQLKAPPRNPKELLERLEKQAFTPLLGAFPDFTRHEKILAATQNLSYETFLEKAKKSLDRSNKKRLAFLVSGILDKAKSLQYEKIQDVTSWKMKQSSELLRK